MLPRRARGRPSRICLSAEVAYNEALAAYNIAILNLADYHVDLQAYEGALLEHNAIVNRFEANEIVAPLEPLPDLINTHGRGSNLDNGAVVAFTTGIARLKTVLSFNDPGDLNHRAATFRALLNANPSVDTLGGRSMGARAAARAQLYTVANKLIFFTYPLVRGRQERYEELLALDADVDVLFVVGDEDPLCVELHLQAIRSRMKAPSWWLKVARGNHALNFDHDLTKRYAICNVAGQIAAAWSMEEGRDPEKTELTLDWDEDTRTAVWTPWMAPLEKPERKKTNFEVAILNADLPGGGGKIGFSL